MVTCAGIIPPRALATNCHWTLWTTFCTNLCINLYLSKPTIDPILLLWIFTVHYCNGTIAPHGQQVQSFTVENALHSVGQAMALLGALDPWLNQLGTIDFCLSCLLQGFRATDPAPNCTQPIPLRINHTTMEMATTSLTGGALAIADMACIAFFFLLCPGKYTASSNSNNSFTINDIQLLHDDLVLPWNTTPEPELLTANYVTYTFQTQKMASKVRPWDKAPLTTHSAAQSMPPPHPTPPTTSHLP